MVWKADTKLLKMVARHAWRSCFPKPPALMMRICFSTVDFPLSPAPVSRLSTSISIRVLVGVATYRAAGASPRAPPSSCPSGGSSQSPHCSWTWGPGWLFVQSTLSRVPYNNNALGGNRGLTAAGSPGEVSRPLSMSCTHAVLR